MSKNPYRMSQIFLSGHNSKYKKKYVNTILFKKGNTTICLGWFLPFKYSFIALTCYRRFTVEWEVPQPPRPCSEGIFVPGHYWRI